MALSDPPQSNPAGSSATPLLDLHLAQRGKVSDKWSAYFPVYERTLGPLRQRPLSMLEIGVQNGGSLDVWSRYFPNATVIVGCDIDERCARLTYEDPRVRVVVADANADAGEAGVLRHATSFDVVIDDGSHLSDHIIQSFLTYFQHLKPGGVYIVEDTHTLFWEPWGGGILKRNSAQAFFKLIADLVNAEHWARELDPAVLFTSFFPRSRFPSFMHAGEVASVEFANSMIVLRKSAGPEGSRLGARLVTGQTAAVDDGPLRATGQLPPSRLAP